MKDYCQFLQMKNDREPVCTAGVNFYNVGQNREICRACPLADLGDILLCKYLDVYVYQDWSREGQVLRIEGECCLGPDTPAGTLCPGCPAPGQLRPADTLAKAIALTILRPLEEQL